MDLSIEYQPGHLNSTDAPSWKPDYEKDAKNLEGAIWVKENVISIVASLIFLSLPYKMALLDEVLFKDQEMRPWVFLLVENKNDQGDIITYTILYKAANGESAYKKIFLTMQTAI